MDKNKVIQDFYDVLDAKGYKGKIVSARYIPDLQNSVKKFNDQQLFDPEFYEEYKKYFDFEPKTEFGEVKSLFLVAMPQPQYEIVLTGTIKKCL